MKTRKLSILVVAALFLVLTGFAAQSYAGVHVGIGVNIPVFTFAAPPPLVVIPGTYAYYAPDADVDIIFYHGYWYRPYEGRWFRARGYNGPWGVIAPARVPGVLIGLPHDFRHVYRDHPRVEYRDFHRNWRSWERNRHWESNERWREGRGHGEGRGHDRHEGRHDGRGGERHEGHRDR